MVIILLLITLLLYANQFLLKAKLQQTGILVKTIKTQGGRRPRIQHILVADVVVTMTITTTSTTDNNNNNNQTKTTGESKILRRLHVNRLLLLEKQFRFRYCFFSADDCIWSTAYKSAYQFFFFDCNMKIGKRHTYCLATANFCYCCCCLWCCRWLRLKPSHLLDIICKHKTCAAYTLTIFL